MILLTGAGGFIGKALRSHFTSRGQKVVPVTRGRTFTADDAGISMDLDEPAHYEKLLEHCNGCTTLIHLAGRIDIQFAPTGDSDVRPLAVAPKFADVYAANVLMTSRLLEVAKSAGFAHVVFASSQTVYGLPTALPLREESALAPLEYYAASKAACETALALWSRASGCRVTVLRFPGVWGESRSGGLVHSLCRQAIDAGRLRVGAEYPLPLDVLHCDDVVAAFAAAFERREQGFRVYNIATGESCSLPRLGADVADLVPGCTVTTFGVPQPDVALDVTRAAHELGWRAVPRRERLSRFIGHLREQAHA